jgi:hypothetical protein
MPWFRAYAMPMIEGSVAKTMDDIHQLIWWKLIALARLSKFGDGTLRHGVGIPMKVEWIAKRLGYSDIQVQETIDMGLMDKNMDGNGHRIRIWEDGTIELANFCEYNPMPTPKKPPEEPPPTVDSETKRKAIHDKYQREHPKESLFHLESLRAGVPDTFPELAKARQKEDQRFIRKLHRNVKEKGPLPLPPRLEGL